jgi:transposase InsO family protein
MGDVAKARYTLKFKLEALQLVNGRQSLAAVCKTLGIFKQNLNNWVKPDRKGHSGDALHMGCSCVGLIIRGDRGSEYCGGAFQELRKCFDMRSSMSRKASSRDTALVKTFCSSMKVAHIRGKRFVL